MKSDLSRWTVNDVIKLFNYQGSRQSILKAEREGRIPSAQRLNTAARTRAWPIASLPEIGVQYGFLDKPPKQVKIAIYTAKGGVLKTTITYTLARLFALHGMKTLIVGLDSQGSVTALSLNPLANIDSIDNIPLYHHVGGLIFGDQKVDEVVESTHLPTLDVIPENDSLNELDNRIGTHAAIAATGKLSQEKKRYMYFSEKLIPKFPEYDVILFDNSPSWSFLIENSLFAADYVISPTACDPGSYQVLETNLNAILDFKKQAQASWKKLFLVPTLKDHSRLSSQIHAAYLTGYDDYVTNSFIRKTVKGAEAFSVGASPVEFDVKSDLAEDYFNLAKEIWAEVLR